MESLGNGWHSGTLQHLCSLFSTGKLFESSHDALLRNHQDPQIVMIWLENPPVGARLDTTPTPKLWSCRILRILCVACGLLASTWEPNMLPSLIVFEPRFENQLPWHCHHTFGMGSLATSYISYEVSIKVQSCCGRSGVPQGSPRYLAWYPSH